MSFPRPIPVLRELATRPPPWPRDIWEEEAEGREQQGRLPKGLHAPIPIRSSPERPRAAPHLLRAAWLVPGAQHHVSEGQSPALQLCADNLSGSGISICKFSSCVRGGSAERGWVFVFPAQGASWVKKTLLRGPWSATKEGLLSPSVRAGLPSPQPQTAVHTSRVDDFLSWLRNVSQGAW